MSAGPPPNQQQFIQANYAEEQRLMLVLTTWQHYANQLVSSLLSSTQESSVNNEVQIRAHQPATSTHLDGSVGGLRSPSIAAVAAAATSNDRKRTINQNDHNDDYIRKVKCPLCSHVFCDVGALRIHFGGEHLAERYKCDREDCYRIFSQKRSRDRHSANTNAAIHSNKAHLKEKMKKHRIITSECKSLASVEIEKLSALNPLEIVWIRKNKKRKSGNEETD